MQDVQCPAPIDATDAEIAVCAAEKPLKPTDGGVTTQGGGGGTTNPTDPGTKPTKPKG